MLLIKKGSVLPFFIYLNINYLINFSSNAPVAQLDRASDYGSEGCRFESCRVYKLFGEFYATEASWTLSISKENNVSNAEETVYCYEGKAYFPISQAAAHKTEPIE